MLSVIMYLKRRLPSVTVVLLLIAIAAAAASTPAALAQGPESRTSDPMVDSAKRYDLVIQVIDQKGLPINGVAVSPMWTWKPLWAKEIGPVTWTTQDGFGNQGMANVAIWDDSPKTQVGLLVFYQPHPWHTVAYYISPTDEELRGKKITVQMSWEE